MECNCNNNNSNGGVIPWVRGNRLPLIICVYENVVTQEQVGDSTLTVNEMTRVPYTIQDNDTVTVIMKSGFRQVAMPFTTDGNKVMVTDNGELPTGSYTVEVTIEQGNGARGRWQETRQVRIYENTSDAQLGEMYSIDADLFFYAKGDTGTGIADITNNPDGTLTITMTDGTSYTTEALKGDKGDKGDTGERGVSIVSFDVTGQTDVSVIYTVTFSDDTTQDISVPKGPQGDTGLTGNGISSTTLNSDYTLTIAYTDGTTYTTPSIRGAQGAQGVSVIGFTQTGETATNTMYNLVFSDGRTQSVAIPKGVKGDKGDKGDQGIQGIQGPKGDTVIIGDEQEYTLYNVTGQNTDGAMTQKAVTDALVGDAISYDNSQSGLAATDVQGALDEVVDNISEKLIIGTLSYDSSYSNTEFALKAGHTYHFNVTLVSGTTNTSVIIRDSDGTTNIVAFNTANFGTSFSWKCTQDSTYLRSSNCSVNVYEVVNKAESQFVKVANISDFSTSPYLINTDTKQWALQNSTHKYIKVDEGWKTIDVTANANVRTSLVFTTNHSPSNYAPVGVCNGGVYSIPAGTPLNSIAIPSNCEFICVMAWNENANLDMTPSSLTINGNINIVSNDRYDNYFIDPEFDLFKTGNYYGNPALILDKFVYDRLIVNNTSFIYTDGYVVKPVSSSTTFVYGCVVKYDSSFMGEYINFSCELIDENADNRISINIRFLDSDRTVISSVSQPSFGSGIIHVSGEVPANTSYIYAYMMSLNVETQWSFRHPMLSCTYLPAKYNSRLFKMLNDSQIDNSCYVQNETELLEAIEKSQYIIYIEKDIEITSSLTINKNITVFGNGHGISYNGASGNSLITINADVNMYDITIEGSQELTYLIYVNADKKLHADRCVFKIAQNDVIYTKGITKMKDCDVSLSYENDGVGVINGEFYAENCKFHDCYDEGVSSHQDSYAEVINCEFYKCGYQIGTYTKGAVSSFGGCHLGGGKMGKVIGCYSHDNCTYGIALINFQDLSLTDKEICCNNIVERNGVAGIWCTACRDLILTNNSIINNTGDAIHFGRDTTYTPTVQLVASSGYVSGNIMFGNTLDGVYIDSNIPMPNLHIQ